MFLNSTLFGFVVQPEVWELFTVRGQVVPSLHWKLSFLHTPNTEHLVGPSHYVTPQV